MPDDPKPGDTPVDPGTGGAAPNDPTPGAVNQDELGFSKKQMEQLATLTGRIIKKQLDENVIPQLKPQPSVSDYVPPTGDSDPVKKFNEQLQQMIFEGRVLEANQMMSEFQEKVKTGRTNNLQTEAKKMLTQFADKPMYKEVYSDAEKIASEAIAAGAPPQWAAEHAYYKAVANHAMNKGRTDELDEGSLEHLGGGRPPSGKKKDVKLPPEFESACNRDIAKGLFKSRDEWIANLSPQVKARLG